MREEIMLRRVIIALALILIGVALGMWWSYQQKAYALCMEMFQPAGWVASDAVKAAMAKMGPMYAYKMVGEILYVDRGDGEWLRLRYRNDSTNL